MNQDQYSELKEMMHSLADRIEDVEKQLQLAKPRQVTPYIAPTKKAPVAKAPVEKAKPSNILGIVGVACFILAMILLIKFSIDSGWLNPARQLLLAALFGGSLIAIPHYFEFKDKAYISLLPAAGVVVLHLTIYGAIFFHQILSPSFGIWPVSAVGVLSLWLLKKNNEVIYALLAIAGTYLGSFILKESFSDLSAFALHLIAWDLAFVTFGILLKNRALISITAYFSLGLVAILALNSPLHQLDEVCLQFAVLQLIQILIIAYATATYSIKNKSGLSEDDAWQLFPVFLFFYGQEFYLIDLINPSWATIFSLSFAAVIFAIYWNARRRLGKDHLESSSSVLTFITIMIFHSLYFVTFDFTGKMLFGIGLMMVMGLFSDGFKKSSMKGVSTLSMLVISCSMIFLLFNTENAPDGSLVGFGLIYGVMLLAGYKASSLSLLPALANVMIVTAICRLDHFIAEIWIGPLCVGYAFLNLIIALKGQDKALGKASFPVIFFAIGRFLFLNFSDLSQGERIISLIIMGALIYAGGFVYRQIPDKK